jgi:hypothetical protein
LEYNVESGLARGEKVTHDVTIRGLGIWTLCLCMMPVILVLRDGDGTHWAIKDEGIAFSVAIARPLPFLHWNVVIIFRGTVEAD